MGENSRIFLSTIIKSVLPLAGQYAENKIDEGLMDKNHRLNMQKLQKQEELLGMEKNVNTDYTNIPTFQFEEGEDVDDLGRRMWNHYHNIGLKLPEDAPPSEVRKVAKKMEQSMRNHPCGECKEHIKENLKKVPLSKGIKSKKDLVKRTFELHNEVNTMLEKPEFTPEDFQREYNYPLE